MKKYVNIEAGWNTTCDKRLYRKIEYIDLVSLPEVKESKYAKFSDLPKKIRVIDINVKDPGTNGSQLTTDISKLISVSLTGQSIVYKSEPKLYTFNHVNINEIFKLKTFIKNAKTFMKNTIETQTESVRELLAAFGLESEYNQTEDAVDVSTQTSIDDFGDANIKIDVAGDYCHYFDAY